MTKLTSELVAGDVVSSGEVVLSVWKGYSRSLGKWIGLVVLERGEKIRKAQWGWNSKVFLKSAA